MIVTLLVGLALAAAPPTLGKPKPFPGKQVAKVAAFAMNLDDKGQPECLMPLKDGKPCPSIKARKTLTEAQVKTLSAILDSPASYGEGEPKCFIPHHAFVFYDASDEPVGQVSVCFMCENVRSTPDIAAQPRSPMKSALSEQAMSGLRSLCEELQLPRCK